MSTTPTPSPSRTSALIALLGTATGFVALLIVALVVGAGVMMAMM